MLPQPIVFVIGAGASKEFGMPDGGQMKESIAKALSFDQSDGKLLGDRTIYDLLRSQSDWKKHHDAARELAARIGEFVSIDETLHWFSSRPEIVLLGKIIIVREILEAERASILFNRQDERRIQNRNYGDSWLYYFLSMPTERKTRSKPRKRFTM